MEQNVPDDEKPNLQTSLDKICCIVLKAHEFDAKDIAADEDPGSNPSDDKMVDVLEVHSDDPVRQEMVTFIDSMNDDEQIELVALMWLGRGDGDASEWESIRAEAERKHNENTALYLLGTPLLRDHLEEGLAKLDLSCVDVDFGHGPP
jgi:Protein of unknown function (DUF3775)